MSSFLQKEESAQQSLLIKKSDFLIYIQRNSDAQASDVEIVESYGQTNLIVKVKNNISGNYKIVIDHMILLKIMLFLQLPVPFVQIERELLDDGTGLIIHYQSK